MASASPRTSRHAREYAGEGMYTGQTLHRLRHGTGVLKERNGTILYEGEWKNDKPDGHGRKYFPRSGDCHEGSYCKGERHGLGVYLWANGDRYSGDWHTGLMNGRGKFEWIGSGEVYSGDWGKMTGEGVKVLGDGGRLSGQFMDGKLHGWAEKVFAEGDRYAGYFDMNCRSGYGEYQWSDGRRYRGTWRNDVMHGSGELLTPSDVRAQRGALLRSADTSWIDSVVYYRGEFVEGRMEGYGTARLFDGTIYSGSWKADRWQGWGRVQYSDGSVYEGNFVDGLRCGQGQLVHHMPDADGRPSPEQQGIPGIPDPTLTDPLTTASSTATPLPPPPPPFEPPQEDLDFAEQGRRVSVEAILNTWGGVYLGDWVADQPHGEGTFQLRNGQVYQGAFSRGRISGDGGNPIPPTA